jgi:hypothetical protein
MEWLNDQLDGFAEDDYLLLDCPGQVELYTHVPVMPRIVDALKRKGFTVCAVYTVDSTFITDAAKLIAGILTALSAMVHLEVPHVNVLTKCDLAPDKAALERFLSPSGTALAAELSRSTGPRFARLNAELARLLDEYDMVAFLPLDITDEESLESIMLQVDHAMGYGEDAEPKEPKDGFGDGEEDGAGGFGDGDGEGDDGDGDGGGGGGRGDGYGGNSFSFGGAARGRGSNAGAGYGAGEDLGSASYGPDDGEEAVYER